jgi:hypothetical protein
MTRATNPRTGFIRLAKTTSRDRSDASVPGEYRSLVARSGRQHEVRSRCPDDQKPRRTFHPAGLFVK